MTDPTQNYQPKGTKFYDENSRRHMLLVSDDEPQESLRGLIIYQHPDGQWVRLRKATEADRCALAAAVSNAFHSLEDSK